jgi:hypothetical protein
MAIRTWGYLTIAATDTPQPIFSSTLASAVIAATDGFGQPLPGPVLPFTSAAKFKKGDRLMIVETDGTLLEISLIVGISTNNVTVDKILHSHAAGAWVILHESMTAPYVQCGEANTAIIGIGTGRTASISTGAALIAILEPTVAGVQPEEFSCGNVFGANPMKSSDFWVVGTQSDKILPSFIST